MRMWNCEEGGGLQATTLGRKSFSATCRIYHDARPTPGKLPSSASSLKRCCARTTHASIHVSGTCARDPAEKRIPREGRCVGTHATEAKLVGDAAAAPSRQLASVHDHARNSLHDGPVSLRLEHEQPRGEGGGETDAGGHGVEFVHGGCASPEVELGVVSDVLVRFPEQLVVCSA